MENENMRSKKTAIVMSIISALILICGIYLFYRFYSLNRAHYIKLYENSKLDYKICLKENEFYETKCLDKGNQYIASLIDYIPATFNYDLSFLDANIDYNYSYKIEAEFNVIDKDNRRSLFKKKETLYESGIEQANTKSEISYDLNIDYNKYNDLLSNFISLYDLDETSNSLTVSMHVNISSSGDTHMDDINKNSVISLTIPLTRKTVNVDISGVTNDDNVTNVLVKNDNSYKLILLIAIGVTITSLVLVIYIICYINESRTALEVYQRRIKKITSTYDSYIQRITGNYPIGASQICKVVSFRDMLEIKDSSDKPLLMLENEEKTGTFFIIPVGEGVIYTYALRIEDIMAEKDGIDAPDYGIDDINVTKDEKIRPKKYTKEKIKEDIEKTTSLSIVNDKNAIKGTKNSDENLYDQLQKTASFKVIKEYSNFLDSDTSKTRKLKKAKKTKKNSNK